MAIVTILLGCALGASAGLLQLAFFGASLGQAFLTYVGVSVLLPATVLGASVVIARFRPEADTKAAPRQDDMENWNDWQTEEEMEADRLLCTAETYGQSPTESDHSESSAVRKASAADRSYSM